MPDIPALPRSGQVGVLSGGASPTPYPAGAQVTLDRISGHRDGDATACPGDGLYAQLPELRRMVVPGQPLATTSVALHAVAVNVAYGTKAVLSGLLAGPSGAPFAGQPIDVQMLSRLGTWKTLHRLTSDGAGSVATRLRFAYNHAVRLRFPGGPGLLAAQSAPLALGVRPRVV